MYTHVSIVKDGYSEYINATQLRHIENATKLRHNLIVFAEKSQHL